MGHISKISTENTKVRFVMADKLRPRTWHDLEKTESTFGAATPAVRVDGRDTGMTPDADLQDSIKAAMLAFAN